METLVSDLDIYSLSLKLKSSKEFMVNVMIFDSIQINLGWMVNRLPIISTLEF